MKYSEDMEYRWTFLDTAGSDFEIGYQHGSAIPEPCQKGIAFFFCDLYKRALNTQKTSFLRAFGVNLADQLIQKTLIKRLKKNIPAWAMERIRGLSEGSKLSLDDLCLAFVLPDVLPILEAYLRRVSPKSFALPSLPNAIFGCSSFFYKRSDGLLFGRNLDFPGVGYWDRFPVLQKIAIPGSIPYVAFTTAGMPFGGISGVNEAKIAVCLHQHYSADVSASGKLPYIISEQVLRKAESLSDAQKIIQEESSASAWAFLVADGKKNQASIFEKSAHYLSQVPLTEKYLSHANHFQGEVCRADEFSMSEKMNWDNHFRRLCLSHKLSSFSEDIDIHQALVILSDHTDLFWNQEKIINRTVSQIFNIQSLLLDFSNFDVWLASGKSPIHLNSYQRFDLQRVFSGQLENQDERRLSGFAFKDPSKHRAKIKLVESLQSAMSGDFSKACQQMKMCLSESFEPECAIIYATLLFKQRDFDEAINVLLRAEEAVENCVKNASEESKSYPPEYFEIGLNLARAYRLTGNVSQMNFHKNRIIKNAFLIDALIVNLARKVDHYSLREVDVNLTAYSTYMPLR